MSQLDRTTEAGSPARVATQTARDAAADLARTAREAGTDVIRTAKDEALRVASTAADEARRAGAGVRQRFRDELDRQHREAVERVGTFAVELDRMAGERPDTPAGDLVSMLAARSRAFAAYLDEHGPDRVLRELQEFARRRPGAFILAAAAAGFVAGRVGKGMWQHPDTTTRADQHESPRP